MYPSLRSPVLLACIACVSCSGARPRKVDVDSQVDVSAGLRFRVGVAWPMLDRPGDHPMRVPPRVGAVSAYVDVNGDGRFESFLEPSARCTRKSSIWRCSLVRNRVTIQRVNLRMLTKKGVRDVLDKLTVVGEAYDSSGKMRKDLKLCLDATGQCAEMEPLAFASGSSVGRALSPCQLEGLQGADRIGLHLQTDEGEVAYNVASPPSMSIDLEIGRERNALVLTGTASLPMTHVLVWLGDDLATKVAWSSELDAKALRRSGASFRAEVPRRALSGCPSCKLMVQAVNLGAEHDGVASIAEGRYVIEREVW